ncbi:hypothetical protein WH297_12350 [Ochrobactrum vermis]|uniref:DUF3426 domain-containing protein n=1 Tax=Ochrobactrum vermis TaxID=1827297 RepID=A0ABU8PGG0_9HYPH|nr:hypothetical protein [Ochrobactrum vermis]PQZ31404.1 hypothetical protein CQZ93_12520 [Ochrobactrum vermis]
MMAKQPSTAQISRMPSRGQPPAAWFASNAGPIEDAEFETIAPASSRQKSFSLSISEKLFFTRKLASETRLASEWPGFGYWVFVALCATTVFWVAGGYTLLADRRPALFVGQPALPLISALQLTELKTSVGIRDKSDVLSVAGRIQNNTTEERAAPPLIVTIIYSDGSKRERPLASGEAMLKPGGYIDFETMLPALRGTIEKVDVRLAGLA